MNVIYDGRLFFKEAIFNSPRSYRLVEYSVVGVFREPEHWASGFLVEMCKRSVKTRDVNLIVEPYLKDVLVEQGAPTEHFYA